MKSKGVLWSLVCRNIVMIGRKSTIEAVLFGGADRAEFGWQATAPLNLRVGCDRWPIARTGQCPCSLSSDSQFWTCILKVIRSQFRSNWLMGIWLPDQSTVHQLDSTIVPESAMCISAWCRLASARPRIGETTHQRAVRVGGQCACTSNHLLADAFGAQSTDGRLCHILPNFKHSGTVH